MAHIIIPDKESPPPAASGKEGDGYDRCPADGCLEVDSYWNDGERGTGRLSNRHIYSADRRKGGCGASWSRTDTMGTLADQAKGIDPKWKTRGAHRGRSIFVPTEAYRNNYERAFGHG